MPGGNATGPRGEGPMTGRKAGYCMGFGMPGYANNDGRRDSGIRFGRGTGFGNNGGGYGRRNRFFATGVPGRARCAGYNAPLANFDPEAEKQILKSRAENLQSEMDAIKKRIDELTAKG